MAVELGRLLFFLATPCFFVRSSVAQHRPLHSTYAAGTAVWECNPNFFRTTPLPEPDAATNLLLGETTTVPAPDIPTCAPCTVALACRLGWRAAPCTPTMDALCVPCPALPRGRVHIVEGDCAPFACEAGYTGSDCVPCPKGSYCTGKQQRPCGANCTTLAQGAASPLQCLQTSAEDPYGYSFTYTVTPRGSFPLNASSITATALCPALAAWAEPHGVMQTCTVGGTQQQASVACILAVPRCVGGDFLKWLLERVDVAADTQAIAACMQAPIAPLARPVFREVPLIVPPQRQTLPGLPLDAPRLIIERRKWGQSPGQYLTTLLVIGGVLLGLSMALAGACALACTRRARRRLINRAYDAMMIARRQKTAGVPKKSKV